MKKGYCLAILIILMIGSTALTASALSMSKWPTSKDSAASGYDLGKDANQIAQTSNQVTLTLYVLDGGPNGELLPGVDVNVYDPAGNLFEGITDSRGSIAIKGQPGPWQFTLAKEGYKTSNLEFTVTKSHAAATYLLRTAQSAEPAQSQEPVALTIDVYESNLNGTVLSGVDVTGQDGAGNSFEGTTDLNGVVVISGQPGTWQFTFSREGYGSLGLNYNATETEEVAAYLQRTAPSAQATSSAQLQEPVTFTVYVTEGNLNGTALSGVDVAGKDGAGSSFEGTTDSDGAAVISGQPGTWQFTFSKEGYGTLNLSYDVTETDYGNVYLQNADQLWQSDVPVIGEATPYQTLAAAS